jgi:hypothetical protein
VSVDVPVVGTPLVVVRWVFLLLPAVEDGVEDVAVVPDWETVAEVAED